MFKKYFISIITLSFIFTATHAQKYISLGPVIGFGHSNVFNSDFGNNMEVKSHFHPSFNVGLGLAYSKNPHWGFGGELLYSQEGYKKTFTQKDLTFFSFDEENNASYIRLPLRVYYFFGQYKQKIRPKAYAGPSFGLNLGNKINRTSENNLVEALIVNAPEAKFNAFDLGLQVGIGVNIAVSKAVWLNLDMNYYQGLLDAVKDPELQAGYTAIKTGNNLNNNLSLQVGLFFGLR